jgi:hypothetical protein
MKYSPLFLFDNFVLSTKKFREGYLLVNIKHTKFYNFILFLE